MISLLLWANIILIIFFIFLFLHHSGWCSTAFMSFSDWCSKIAAR